MLGKPLKKRLSSQKWINIMKQDSNPTQTWTRIKIKATRAIDDLILLANKMPEEKQGQIFDETNIFRLIKSILYQNWENWEPFDEFQADLQFETRPKFHGRKANLAKTLVRLGTDVCIGQYRILMKDTPDLAEPIISLLKQSAAICEDIAYRSELMERDMEAEQQARIYLFDWNKIAMSKHKRRFTEFIRNELKDDIELGPIKLSKDGKNIKGTFTVPPFDPECTMSFTLVLDDKSTPPIVGFKIFDVNGKERASKKLVVEKDHGSMFVYAKKKN